MNNFQISHLAVFGHHPLDKVNLIKEKMAEQTNASGQQGPVIDKLLDFFVANVSNSMSVLQLSGESFIQRFFFCVINLIFTIINVFQRTSGPPLQCHPKV